MVETEGNNKMADLYINTINKQYEKEQQRSKTFLILSVILGTILLLTIMLALRGSRKRKATT
jgi:hypothetical protein